jgi:hypothetical protein
MKHTITLYRLPWSGLVNFERREEWYLDREEGMTYVSKLKGEEAAEEAFHLTNAPDEYLEESQKEMLALLDFKGPSLSAGDVVRVAPVLNDTFPEYYMCKSFGWEKFGGDPFKLLRHLIY